MSQEEQKVVVLVADDEPSTLALVASHVRSKGYKVLEASDGDLAWQLAHEHLPDLVVLDVMMPGMSGWEVCRKIREAVSLAHTGVIMLTGIGENLNEMTSPLYGADTYLDKPFEFSKLDECIRDVLARRKKDHAMGRPAETERPSSRPLANAPRGNGMIVTSVAGLSERASTDAEPGLKAARPRKAKAVAATARPPVKAKAKPAAPPAPRASATKKARPAAAANAKAKAKPAAARTVKASRKGAAKVKARPPMKAKPVAKAKPSAKALTKGKMAARKAASKPASKAAKKAPKAAAKAKKASARMGKAAPAKGVRAAPPPRAEPKKATTKAKGSAKRTPSRNEGARA